MMFSQEKLIGAVDFAANKWCYNAYEKYCGAITLEDLFTSDHVSICASRCASGFMYKKDTRKFMRNREYNAYLLRRKVLAGSYTPKYYPVKHILERGKTRKIRPPVFECKVVQKVLCDYMIRPLLTPQMVSTNYASVTGRGTDKMHEDIERTLNRMLIDKAPRVVIITDYKDYFGSIPHKQLRNMFGRYIKDQRIVDLIMLFCEDGPGDCGLSLGNEVSQIPASCYPSPIDHYFKDRYQIPRFRYMDDALSVVSTEDADWYIQTVKGLSEELGLSLPDHKILTLPLGQEFVFCKERYYMSKLTGQYYRMINGNRSKTEIRKLGAMKAENVPDTVILSQYKSVRGSIAGHGHTYLILRKMDAAYEKAGVKPAFQNKIT